MNHDIIVIGASAGGLEVLLGMVRDLPADLPATIFVVLHSSPTRRSHLPELLSSRGNLPTSHPLHGEQIAPGHIYVAVPDMQMLVRQGTIEVVRGARENGHRPAVDATFRTASVAYGPRVIGVVLSGYQDCGTAGMMSIKARGGIAVVQAPETSVAADMPRNVLKRVRVDHVVAPAELGGLLTRLVKAPAAAASTPGVFIEQLEGALPGAPAQLTCPTCQGVLTEARNGEIQRFRCHVGHAFSLESLVREQGEEIERALWAAIRALEEGAALSRRLESQEYGKDLAPRFREKTKTQLEHADVLRQVLLRGSSLSGDDADTVDAVESGTSPEGRGESSEP